MVPADAPPTPLRCVSSMATRLALAELAASFEAGQGLAVQLESVGGVDAARRVAAGEAFDVVCLASDALEALAQAGHLRPGSLQPLARSPIAVAVPAGAALPDIATEAALRDAVRAATSIGYSTGPSGRHLAGLFARWGLEAEVAAKLRTPPPGTPVGALVVAGEVALGFQQLSELKHLKGIRLLGGLPAGCDFVTTFSGAIASASARPADAARLLAHFSSPAAQALWAAQGMEPPTAQETSAA